MIDIPLALGEPVTTEQRPMSPSVEIAIQSILLIAMSLVTINTLQTARPWDHPSATVGILVSSAIGISVGVRENRIKFWKRLLIVTLWCGVVSAVCVVRGVYYPLPEVPGRIFLYRDYPLALAFFGSGVFWVGLGFIGLIWEEGTALSTKCVSWWLNR